MNTASALHLLGEWGGCSRRDPNQEVGENVGSLGAPPIRGRRAGAGSEPHSLGHPKAQGHSCEVGMSPAPLGAAGIQGLRL